MKPEVLERRLLAFVRRKLLGPGIELMVDENTALFEEGIVNSLRILDLIAFVEKETGGRIPDEQVRLANFRSVRAIAAAFGAPRRRDALPVRSNAPRPWGVVPRFERRATGLGPRPPGSSTRSPIDQLEDGGGVTLVPPGRAVFRGGLSRLLRFFDSVALDWAREMGAAERIPFPRDASDAQSAPPPAACYHVYPAFQGRLAASPPILVTLRRRCFRDEAEVDLASGRLRDFQMREIVAIGERDEVEAFRRGLIDRVWELVTSLDLDGRIETASDPFFADPAASGDPAILAEEPPARERRGRRLMQQILPLKYELRLALGEGGRTCAVASFNHHLDFFGRRFEMRLPSGTAAHSGCVAFGLERWVLAFVAHHGADARDWPDRVREFCAAGGEHARHG